MNLIDHRTLNKKDEKKEKRHGGHALSYMHYRGIMHYGECQVLHFDWLIGVTSECIIRVSGINDNHAHMTYNQYTLYIQ